MKTSVKKLCTLLIFGSLGMWSSAETEAGVVTSQDANQQETANFESPACENERPLLESMDGVFQNPASNAITSGSPSAYAAPLPTAAPISSYSGEKRNYLGTNQLFYEIEITTDHVWFSGLLFGLETWANSAIQDHNENEYTNWPCLFAWTYSFAPVLKENGEAVVSFKKAKGFKLKDLMHYFRAGGKIGWAGGLNSCFGVYGRFYYEHQRQFIRLQHEDTHEYAWTNAIMPGIGVRFTPQFWTDEDQVNPYFEVGTTYTHIIGCKSRYGKDKDQFGHGLTYSFGVGIRGNGQYRNSKIFLGLELPQYDFFNRKWSNDGGYYFPYANVRDRRWRITVNLTIPIALHS